MEESENVEAPLSRKSPRLKRKNQTSPDAAPASTVHASGTDDLGADLPKHNRKRKKGAKKDSGRQQNVGFKCSPARLSKLIKRLNNDQIKWVKECGFGSLLEICECTLPKGFTLWLINRVDHRTGVLDLWGTQYPIKPFVKKLLGLARGNVPFNPPCTVRGKSKVFNPTEEYKEYTDPAQKRGKSIEVAIEDLVNCDDKEKFQKKFIIVALCIYLAPSSSLLINRNYLECLTNMDQIQFFNWCDYLADYLCQGIREYRESNAANIFVHGCVHILVLMYKDILKDQAVEGNIQFPRISDCTHNLEEFDATCRKPQQVRYITVDELLRLYNMEESELQASETATPFRIEPALNIVAGKAQQTDPTPSNCEEPLHEKDNQNKLQLIEKKYRRDRDECLSDMKRKIDKLHAAKLVAIKQMREKMEKIDAAREAAIADLFDHGTPGSIGKSGRRTEIVAKTSAAASMEEDVQDIAHAPSKYPSPNNTEQDADGLQDTGTDENNGVPPASEPAFDTTPMLVRIAAESRFPENDGANDGSDQLLHTGDLNAPTKEPDFDITPPPSEHIASHTAQDGQQAAARRPESAHPCAAQRKTKKVASRIAGSVVQHHSNLPHHPPPNILLPDKALEVSIAEMTREVPVHATGEAEVGIEAGAASHDVMAEVQSIGQEASKEAELNNAKDFEAETSSRKDDQTLQRHEVSYLWDRDVEVSGTDTERDRSEPPAASNLVEVHDISQTPLWTMPMVVPDTFDKQGSEGHNMDEQSVHPKEMPAFSASATSGPSNDSTMSDPRKEVMFVEDTFEKITAAPLNIQQDDAPRSEDHNAVATSETPLQRPDQGPATIFDTSGSTMAEGKYENLATLGSVIQACIMSSPIPNDTPAAGQDDRRDGQADPVADASQSCVPDSFVVRIASVQTPLEAEDPHIKQPPQEVPTVDLNQAMGDDTFAALDLNPSDQFQPSIGTFQDSTQQLYEDAIFDQYAGYTPCSADQLENLTGDVETPTGLSTTDACSVPRLAEPVIGGESFLDAGSVNTAVKNRTKRYMKKDEAQESIQELVKSTSKTKGRAGRTYKEHVEAASSRQTSRTWKPTAQGTGKVKVSIRGAHVTEDEFVQVLKPNGQVDLNFMWLCCVAIMADWDSQTKLILDQPTIKELMREFEKCDHANLVIRLRKLAIREVEQLYLPTCDNNHWILVVVNLPSKAIEIYDSIRTVKKGKDPHSELLGRMMANLQVAISGAREEPTPVADAFPKHYEPIPAQQNNHDYGFIVIRLLQCHNGKDLIGHAQMTSHALRTDPCHTLLYHRLNEYNPLRGEHQPGFRKHLVI